MLMYVARTLWTLELTADLSQSLKVMVQSLDYRWRQIEQSVTQRSRRREGTRESRPVLSLLLEFEQSLDQAPGKDLGALEFGVGTYVDLPLWRR